MLDLAATEPVRRRYRFGDSDIERLRAWAGPSGARWGRPVAAVTGPDGAVYVTDDDAGAVYRVAPPGR